MGIVKDLTGQRFGLLTVIKRAENGILPCGRAYVQWLCRCDCGNTKIVSVSHLRNGDTKTCGDTSIHKRGNLKQTHGCTNERLYKVWKGMKRRCYNPNAKRYPRYGGRGITMCKEWKDDYLSFRKWALEAGYDPSAKRGECTIDRINNNLGYFPNNCRWATIAEQNRNTSRTHC